MTVPVPPPHLLKKFSAQARESSQKRGAPNHLKAFAMLCIEWALQEGAMVEYRAASADVSNAKLNSQSTPNDHQIRSSSVWPSVELVHQWFGIWQSGDDEELSFADFVIPRAAQWGADQELEACCEWLEQNQGRWEIPVSLRAARRPKPPSLKEQALAALERYEAEEWCEEMTFDSSIIRRALKALPND